MFKERIFSTLAHLVAGFWMQTVTENCDSKIAQNMGSVLIQISQQTARENGGRGVFCGGEGEWRKASVLWGRAVNGGKRAVGMM